MNKNHNPFASTVRNAGNVLIVDDEIVQRALMTEVIKSGGESFEIYSTDNGYEALNILEKHSIDVVLIDKCMPIINGDELVSEIRNRAKFKLLPIIMVTGNASSEDLSHSLEVGANDFVCKPFLPLELLARIRSAIRSKQLTDQLDHADTLLFNVAKMVESKDPLTSNHCYRLSQMAKIFGEHLNLSRPEIENLVRGSIVHDIGKLGIPDAILLKPGSLDKDEWEIMESHTTIGADLIDGLSSFKEVIPIVLYHHERWNGTGYPYRLAGEEIPLLARVFQIIDVFDALRSTRPYKDEMSLEVIFEILHEETEKGYYDPHLVSQFINFLQRNPDIFTFKELKSTATA